MIVPAMTQLCPRYVSDRSQLCPGYNLDISQMPKIQSRYVPDMSQMVQDMSSIYPRCVQYMFHICSGYVTDISDMFPRNVSSLEKDVMTWTSPEARVTLVSAQLCHQPANRLTNQPNIEPLQICHYFDRLGDPYKSGVQQYTLVLCP